MSGSESSSSFADDNETWDDWVEDDQQPCKSLFSDAIFPSPVEAVKHDRDTHGFDLVLLARTLDFFERIRLINYIRANKPEASAFKRLDRSVAWLDDDTYLKPVIEDDPLLLLDYDSLDLDNIEAPGSKGKGPVVPTEISRAQETDDLITDLRARLVDAEQNLQRMRDIVRSKVGLYDEVSSEASASTSAAPAIQKKPRDDDSHYFESYGYNEIHEIMLRDRVRTSTYEAFILSNPELFKGKAVLDVGCGTGILSMFCAKAGARKVYAVDASNVAFKAMRNVRENGLESVVQVIKGKMEEISIPEQVDVIVSEWMGYFLLYESMLDSVLYASKFLAPGGVFAPSQTTILLALHEFSAFEERQTFWNDVYGFKMPDMAESMEEEALMEVVPASEVVSPAYSPRSFVTRDTKVADVDFETRFELTATKSTTVRAFAGWFDTFFTTDNRLVQSEKDLSPNEKYFTTGPHGEPTHWKQTLFALSKPEAVEKGTVIQGTFKCDKSADNSRELVVQVTWTVTSPAGAESELRAQVWKVR